MKPPLIGITTSRERAKHNIPVTGVSHAYVQAVVRAGGMPVLIPSTVLESDWAHLRQRLDGLLLSGGGDLDPAHFNGESHPRLYGIEPERDRLELELARLAVESGWSLLGICRGAQVLNVAQGGTLYTHIADQHPNALRHDYFPDVRRDYLAHPVRVEAQCRLASILGETTLPVNSLHHQGIQQLAPGLVACAWAPDGLVEAIELPSHPFAVGVQWHPEWLPDAPAMQALFKAFVQAAGNAGERQ